MKHLVLAMLALAIVLPASAERLVRLYDAVPSTVQLLLADHVEIAAVNLREGWVDICLPDRDTDRASLYSSRSEVLPLEWGMLLDENRGNAGYYYSWEENNAFWATFAAAHSDLVDTPVSIGTTVQGRPINMVLMTSNAGGYKPALLFTALVHAREPIGTSVLIDFANWLATSYGSDTMATWILDHTRVYFVPIVNIDSYILNCNPAGGMIRKNQSPPDGVDLNRNFAYMWGYDDYGSSPDPYDDTYRGPSAASEPETQAIQNFINSIQPIAGMHYHSYGGYLLRPFGYNNSNTPDEATYASWSSAMTQYNGYAHGQCGDVLGYNANGDGVDWSYAGTGHPKMMAFTPEVDDNGFWGGQNDTTLIANLCAECRYMNKWLCFNAPQFVGVEEESGSVVPGAFAIGPVTPNPVNSQASFTITLPSAQGVELAVYDISGRMVSRMGTTGLRIGDNTVTFLVPDDLPSGVYSVRASCGGLSNRMLFTLLR